jgi:hypothetical protein
LGLEETGGSQMRTRLVAGAALIIATVGGSATAAGAQSPNGEDTNCWGVVSSQRAVAEGGLGEHSSSFDTPREGLGNVVRSLGFDHIGEMGAFFGQIDGIEATECG